TRAVGVDVYADWVTALSLMAMAGFILDPGITPVIVRRLIQDPGQAPRPRTLLLTRLGLGALGALFVTAMTTLLRGPDALFVGAEQVAEYLFAFQFIEQLFVLGAIVGSAVLPLMAVRARDVDPFEDGLTHRMLVSLGAGGALGALALIAFAEPITRLIGGPEL